MVTVRTRDDVRWSEQTAELRAEETGRRFLTFFEFWFDTADVLIAEEDLTSVVAMRQALQIAESQFGFLTVDWIGQMLAVAATHWEHGEAMLAELSNIEHRVMTEAIARKIAALQESANLPVEDLQPEHATLGDSDG